MSKRINRREFLRLGAMTGAGLALAAYDPRPAMAAPKAAEKTIRFTPQAYYNLGANPEVSKATEEIFAEYEKTHPDVKVELIDFAFGTESDYRTWLTTRMAAREAPEIAWEHFYLRNQQAAKGWWMPLDEYLEKANPYIEKGIPGSERWADQLPEYVWAQTRAGDGLEYQVSLDWVETGLFYNKTIFEKEGLSADWKEWPEFIETLKTLKEKGYQPFDIFMTIGWSTYQWADDVLMTAAWADQVQKWYLPKYSSPVLPWRTLVQEELAKAIFEGKFSTADPRFDKFLELMKEWSQYWVEGFTGMKTMDPLVALFLTEQVPIAWLGTWNNNQVLTAAKFDVGITYFPPVPKSVSPYEIHNTFYRTGGPSSAGQYGITMQAKEDGLADLAVDVLMYWSAPQNFGEVCKMLGAFIPMVAGAEIGAIMEGFKGVASLPERGFTDPLGRLTPEQGETYDRIMQRFLLGEIDAKQAKAEIQESYDAAVKKLCEENKWEWCK